MLSHSHLCCCVLTFVVYLIACALPMVTSDDVDSKRPWDMVRESRGLQMLRLGKRDPSDLTDGEMQRLRQLYDIILRSGGESRDPTRRQPPLPRYGRELLTGRDFLELIARDPNPIIMRPPPRAGRYRRSVAEDESPFGRIRSVVRPRIGRHLRQLHLETKAVSRPRIGREPFFPSTGTDDSVDGMVDFYQ